MAHGGIFPGPIERDPDNPLKIRDGVITSIPVLTGYDGAFPKEKPAHIALEEWKQRAARRKAGGADIGVMPWQTPPSKAWESEFKRHGGDIATLASDDTSWEPSNPNYLALSKLPTHDARVSLLRGTGTWTDREVTQLVNELPPVAGSTTSTTYKFLVGGMTLGAAFGASAFLTPMVLSGPIFAGGTFTQLAGSAPLTSRIVAGIATQQLTESGLKGIGAPGPVALGASLVASGPIASLQIARMPFTAGISAAKGTASLARTAREEGVSAALRPWDRTQAFVLPKIGKLTDFGQLVAANTTPDKLRSFAQLGSDLARNSLDGGKRATAARAWRRSMEILGGLNAIGVTKVELAVIGHNAQMAEAATKVIGRMKALGASGNTDKLFGATERKSAILKGEAVGLSGARAKVEGPLAKATDPFLSQFRQAGKPNISLGDVFAEDASTLKRKWNITLSAEQEAYKRAFREANRDMLKILEDAGFRIPKDVKERVRDQRHWIGRRVLARRDKQGNILELGVVDPANAGVGKRFKGYRLGGDPDFLKPRAYASEAKGIEAGFEYMHPVDVLEHNLLSAYRAVIDENFSQWVIKNTDMTLRNLSKDDALYGKLLRAKDDKANAEELGSLVARVKRGESLHPATLKKIREMFPQIEGKLSEASRTTIRQLLAAEKVEAKKIRRLRYDVDYGATSSPEFSLTDAEAALRSVRETAEKALSKSAIRSLKKEQAAAISELSSFAKTEAGTATGRIKELKRSIKEAKEALKEKLPEGFDEASRVYGSGLKGYKWSDDVAKQNAATFEKYLGRHEHGVLEEINKWNAVPRLLTLAMDTSTWLIQLIYLAAFKPKIWKEQALWSIRAIFDPAAYSKFAAQHADTLQNTKSLLLSANRGEFTEAMQRGGYLAGGAKRFTAPLTPFQRGFETSLDVSGVLMREALVTPGMGTKEVIAVEGFINHMRGLSSSAAIGVSRRQQLIESAVLLAPRYRRAMFSLFADAIRGVPSGAKRLAGARPGFTAGGAGVTPRGAPPPRRADVMATRTGTRVQPSELEGISAFRGAPAMQGGKGINLPGTMPRFRPSVPGIPASGSPTDLRTSLAFEAMSKMMAGTVGAFMAIDYGIAQNAGLSNEQWARELPGKLNPDDPKFLTWNIAGQNIGPGSKLRSDLRFVGDLAAAIIEGRPGDLVSTSRRNPFFRWAEGQLSPIAGTTTDYVTSKDFMGEPRDLELNSGGGLLKLTEHLLLENGIPIWAQGVALDGGTAFERAMRAPVEFVGLRALPASRTGRLDRVITELVIDKDGNAVAPHSSERVFEWSDVNRQAQELIRSAEPIISAIDEEFSGDGVYEEYQREVSKSRDNMKKAETNLRDGLSDGRAWRNIYAMEKAKLATLREREGLQEFFKELEQRSSSRQQKLRNQYYDLQKGFFDGEGLLRSDLDFDGWYEAEAQFLAELAPDDREWIDANTRITSTPMEQRYKEYKELLMESGWHTLWKEHWVMDAMPGAYGDYKAWLGTKMDGRIAQATWERDNAEALRMIKMVSQYVEQRRESIRSENPLIDAGRILFQDSVPVSDAGYAMYLRDIDNEVAHLTFMQKTPGGKRLSANELHNLERHGINTLKDLRLASDGALYAAFGATSGAEMRLVDSWDLQARAEAILLSAYGGIE
jgi:hypothetical protein